MALFAGPGPSRAEPLPLPAEPVVAAADTGSAGTPRVQAADTVAAGHEAKKPFFSSPTGIMFRSLLIPGWGQASNHAWVKAVLVAGAETALAVSVIQDTNKLKTLDASDPDYGTIYDHRQRNAWWLGGVVFLSMVDAYVDAHLKGFDVQLGPEPSNDELRFSARIGVK